MTIIKMIKMTDYRRFLVKKWTFFTSGGPSEPLGYGLLAAKSSRYRSYNRPSSLTLKFENCFSKDRVMNPI